MYSYQIDVRGWQNSVAWKISWVELLGMASDTISDVDSGVVECFRKAPLVNNPSPGDLMGI